MDEIMAYVDRTDIDFFDELQNIYTESRQNIQKEIYAFYAQYAKENKISVQEAKKRLMREDLSDYRADAEKYFKQAKKDPELLKRLNEQYKAGKVTRLEALHLNLDWQLGKMNSSLHKSFESYLKEVAQYAYRKIAGGNSQSTLNKSALEQIVKTPFNGKNYSTSIWGNTDDLAKDLKKVLTQGFIRGSGPADMARELRKKYNVAKSRAEAIVRTDGTNVVNLSAAKRFEELGLTRYKNNVHVDSRTTDICLQINREDKSYLLSEYQPGKTAPPYHVGCRTGIVPDDDELGYKDEENKLEYEEYSKPFDFSPLTEDNIGNKNRINNVIACAKSLVNEYKEKTGIDVLSEWKNKTFVDRNNAYNDNKAKFIEFLLNKTGFNKLPTQKSNITGLDALYRGIGDFKDGSMTVSEQINQLEKGDMLISGGRSSTHGRGIYFSIFDLKAREYAKKATNGEVFEYYLSNDSKVLTADLLKQEKEAFKEIYSEIEGAEFYQFVLASNHLMDRNTEIYSILSGYDAYEFGHIKVIYNRGKLVIKK